MVSLVLNVFWQRADLFRMTSKTEQNRVSQVPYRRVSPGYSRRDRTRRLLSTLTFIARLTLVNTCYPHSVPFKGYLPSGGNLRQRPQRLLSSSDILLCSSHARFLPSNDFVFFAAM